MEEILKREELRKATKKKLTIFDLKRNHQTSYTDSRYGEELSRKYISKYKPSLGVEEFYNQLATNREYLSKFDGKVAKICEREKYRNYLNERFY